MFLAITPEVGKELSKQLNLKIKYCNKFYFDIKYSDLKNT